MVLGAQRQQPVARYPGRERLQQAGGGVEVALAVAVVLVGEQIEAGPLVQDLDGEGGIGLSRGLERVVEGVRGAAAIARLAGDDAVSEADTRDEPRVFAAGDELAGPVDVHLRVAAVAVEARRLDLGELALDLQPALLRALDKRAVRRVGGNAYEQVDVRVIAATNRDLREEVARKSFREDLFYRLAVIRVHLPALRERGRDIDVLTEHFIRQFSPERGLQLPPSELQRLRSYAWPGNVRELRNVIERACVLSKGQSLNVEDALGDEIQAPLSIGFRMGLPFKEAKGQLVEQFEREYIVDLMKRHRMNLSAAAREAQIDRKHLRELLRKYGLDTRVELPDGH